MTSSNERNSSDIYLVDYFIFCPSLCEKEGQEGRKILYYHPSDADIDRQIRRVGYCEGLVKFTETFGFESPCETVHFQKIRLLFHKVENDICLAMALHIPVTERKKDEKFFLEYNDEIITDRLVLPILQMSYRYFVLQQGLMSVTLHHEGVDKLKAALKEHFDTFIEYYLNDMIAHMNIDSSLFGIEFLPIDKKVYLKIQSILRRFEVRLPSLKQTFFLYRDQIIWSGLSQDDTTLLYSFFRRYYWPTIKTFVYTSGVRYFAVNTNAQPMNALTISTDLISQEFYLEDSFLPYRIIVINLNLFTMFCIFYFDDYLPDNEHMLSTIESFQKDLSNIVYDFEEYSQRKYPVIDQTVKTIYFNKINSAQVSTIDWSREPHNTIGGIINTLTEDLQWLDSAGEVMVKRENDPWIVVKRSDMRDLILTINHKNANLKEISEKIKQIFSTQFNNIFLLR